MGIEVKVEIIRTLSAVLGDNFEGTAFNVDKYELRMRRAVLLLVM